MQNKPISNVLEPTEPLAEEEKSELESSNGGVQHHEPSSDFESKEEEELTLAVEKETAISNEEKPAGMFFVHSTPHEPI